MKRLLLMALGCLTLVRANLDSEEAHHQGGVATVRTGQVLGEPWQDQKSPWRLRVFTSYLLSRSNFDAEGKRNRLASNGRFSNWNLNLFGEYAFTDRWSGSALLPFQRSSLKSDVQSDQWNSIGDVYGWARYRFNDIQGISPSVLAGAKIPGNYKAVSGIGDGQADYEVQGFLAKPFTQGNYIAVNTGYRYRTSDIADEIIFGGQFGFALTRGWSLAPSLNGVKGIGSGIQKDFLNAGVTVFKKLAQPWSLLFSYNRILFGKNTVGADIWSVGIGFR